MAAPTYWNGNIPWISAKDMKVSRIQDSVLRVTERAIGNGTRLAPAGAVLIVVRGMILAHTVPVAITMRPVAFNQDIKALNAGSSTLSDFVFYWLRANQEQILAIASESTHGTKRIPSSDLFSLRVAVPPLHEQRAIVTALRDVDSLIEGLERLIAKKRDIKQAAMQQLLTGRTRLPGFDGEWRETTLGEIGECVIGLTFGPQDVAEGGLLVLRSSNIRDGKIDYSDKLFVDLDVPDHLHTRSGDILVCVRNGSRALIGKCAPIDEKSVGLTFGAFMSVYRTKHWRFIYHAFQSHGIQRQIRDNMGATINQITNKDMRALRLQLPHEPEQTAIAQVLTDMDTEIRILEQRLAKTQAIKQAMMQELLTGRTRLLSAQAAHA